MRLFVAFEIPPGVRQEVERRLMATRRDLPRARWVRPEGMHLTLSFLGETESDKLAALHPELTAAFASGSPFELRVGAVGAFPPRGRARVLWAALEPLGGDLPALQAAVVAAVERGAGVEPERRPFHPHLTLARCNPPWPRSAVDKAAAAFGGPIAETFTVREGTLFESELHPTGARYRVVRTYPLGVGS